MIEDYIDKIMQGTRKLILCGHYKDYVREVPFMASLAEWMTAQGWRSTTNDRYPNSNMIPDMTSSNLDRTCTVVCEEKHYVRSYPTEKRKYRTWNASTIKQYLGIADGKKINAVHDVTHKLGLVKSTHVAFLLVRVEAQCNPGDDDINKFIIRAALSDDRWIRNDLEWDHPTDPAYRFFVHFWIRPAS